MDVNKITCFIINLKHSTERKKHMQELCEKYGLNYEFIEAVDGRTLSEEEVAKVYPKKEVIKTLGREMSRGEIGVVLSQKQVYKKMLKNNIEVAMIFEDDIDFNEELKAILKQLNSFPKDWNLVLLGHHPDRSCVVKTSYSFWNQTKLNGYYKLVRPTELAVGAYGYLLKKSAAQILLNQLSIIEKPIDHLTGSDEKLNLYILTPPVIHIHQDLSDNYHNMEDRKKLQEELKNKKILPKRVSRKRKLLIVLHLDRIWDTLRSKFYKIKKYFCKPRKYEKYR